MAPIRYKTEEDIEQLRIGADILSRLLGEIAGLVKPGITTLSLDKFAHDYIHDLGCTPSFLNYQGFPYSLCISVNDEVVHGFPSEYVIKEGDLVSVDGGVTYNGYITDSAYTFAVGQVSPQAQQLLDVTLKSLELGAAQAVVGKRVGDISNAVQEYVNQFGYGIVRELVGHGVGFALHEKPEIPNYGKKGAGVKLNDGLVICIEPMINMGQAGVKWGEDGWTISTLDGQLSAHFEYMVVVRSGQPEVLTTFEHIENVLIKNR